MTISAGGTGTVSLGSATSGYQTFASAGVTDQEVLHVCFIDSSGAWEESICVYSASGTTLSHELVASSTGSLLNLTTSATAFVTVFAQDFNNAVALMPADSVIGSVPTIEDTATNLIPGSDDFSNATYWTLTGLTATANSTESPDGGTNAALLTTSSGSTQLAIGAISTTIPANTTYTVSGFVKLGSGIPYASIRLHGGGGAEFVAFIDLVTGAIVHTFVSSATLVNAGSYAVGNGWFRIWVSGYFANVTVTAYFNAANTTSETWTGGAGKTFYLWGADLTLGSTPRSHISTGSTAVTCPPGLNTRGSVVAPAGSVTTAALIVGGSAGIYAASATSLDISVAGSQVAGFSAAGLNLPSGAAFSVGGVPVLSSAVPAGQCYLSLRGASTATAVTSGSTPSGSSTIATTGTTGLTSSMVSIGNLYIADGTVITISGSNINLSAPTSGGTINSGTILTLNGVLQLMPRAVQRS
jgi:hypothetical protein